ncbi:MAG TPA: T9SS type A sorting domain-containing protein [candidate division WOR-3 bacterium]|uniref:T9SS type A sorting domain-containing protein n=1 Tax=candidate division WOR-3 bacterium TaxID=2052148 RepID=A0A9C9K0X8_UNCW3|nr:T9SS type A sorting domain-containing protein [candidate division WOR-3 bacterium]
MDFNNDGLLDLIVGDRNGYVNYFRRLSNGTLTEEPDLIANGVTINVGLNSAPQIIDWNEDGLLDLIIGNDATSGERIRLYLNSGTPSQYLFTTYSELQYTNATYISFSRCNPHVTDLNNDGKKDLVIGEDYGHVYYLENVGTNAAPQFSEAVMLEANGSPISFPSGYTDLKVWVDDWNEDGTKDLIVGNYKDSVHLYIAYPIGVKEEEKSSIRDVVFRAVPNPASTGTVIHYQAVNSGAVNLSVYDIEGRLIKTIAAGYREPGVYQVFWNGMDESNNPVGNGVYLYRLSTEDGVYVNKLIVLR